jgi:membrane protein required for colicin V production
MLAFNWIDCVMLAIIAFSLLAGLARGLVKEIIALIGLIAAFVVASLFSSPLADSLANTSSVQHALNHAANNTTGHPPQIAIGLSFALLFIGTIIVFSLISFILNLLIQSSFLSAGNRLLGAVFGLIRGGLIDLAIIFLVQLTSYGQGEAWQKSQMVQLFQPAVTSLGALVSPSLAKLEALYPAPSPTSPAVTPAINTQKGTPHG